MRKLVSALMLASLTLLGGCFVSDGSNGGGNDGVNNTNDASSFVRSALQATSDNTEPADINGRNFSFSEEEGQYDDLLQQ